MLVRAKMVAALRCLLWAALLLSAVPGCGETSLLSTIDAVEPDYIFANQSNQLSIRGHFLTRIDVSAQTGEVVEDKTFTASLVWQGPLDATAGLRPPDKPYPLSNVTYLSNTELSATTPDLMAPGYYTVEVVDPRGRRALLDGDVRVTVSQSSPDHADLYADQTYVLTDDIFPIQIQIEGTDEQAVPFAGRVSVTLIASWATVYDSTLRDIETTHIEGGYLKLEGNVDENGSATVWITDSKPEDITIDVQSHGLKHLVADGELDLEVLYRGFQSLEISFPDSEVQSGASSGDDLYAVEAGVAFPVMVQARDGSGNPTDGVSGAFFLFDSKGRSLFGPQGEQLQDGVWSGQVTLVQATELNELFAVGPVSKVGTSDYFKVLPGPPRNVNVELLVDSGSVVVAGEAFGLRLTQTDAYGNPVLVSGEPSIDLRDQTGTMVCGEARVESGEVMVSDCRIDKATPGDVIRAQIDLAQGNSRAFQVTASELSSLALALPPTAITAGSPFTLKIVAVDVFGNPVGGVGGVVRIQDAPVDGEPELTVPPPVTLNNGIGTLEGLVLTRAVTATRFHGELQGTAVIGDSSLFPVRPGPAARFGVTVDPVSIVAGATASVSLTAFDAYGNQATGYSGQVSLADPAGELAAGGYSLGNFVNGQANGSFILTRAGAGLILTATDGSGVTGLSNPFQVVAAAMDHVVITDPLPLHWKDKPFSLRLEVVDVYKNVVTSFTDKARVSDKTSSIELAGSAHIGPLDVGPFVAGAFEGMFVITQTMARDSIHATINSIGGTTDGFPVYSDTCNVAPQATLSVNGGDQAVACVGTSAMNFVATGVSTSGISDYVWEFDDGSIPIRGLTLSRTSHLYETVGHFQPAVAVVDNYQCATWANVTVFSGANDQTPAGPITLKSDSSSVYAAKTDGTGATNVQVKAYTCNGDQATAGGLVTVLGSLGAILPADTKTQVSDANPDQAGIQYALDSHGKTTFTFSAATTHQGGTARVAVAYVSGGVVMASGSVEIQVKNDTLPPYVVSYQPAGRMAGVVTDVRIQFDEPLRTVTPPAQQSSDIRVVDSRGNGLNFGRALSVDGRTLTLTLNPPIDLGASTEVITVSLPSVKPEKGWSLTDLDGVRLDGNWDGIIQSDDSFSFRFGSGLEASTGGAGSCLITEPVFSPDGQNGTGEQADITEFQAIADATQGLRAFAVEILDPIDMTPVAWRWMAVQGTTSSPVALHWDGRGLDGQVLANAEYPFTLWTVDVNDNWLGAHCPADFNPAVEIGNPINLGEYP